MRILNSLRYACLCVNFHTRISDAWDDDNWRLLLLLVPLPQTVYDVHVHNVLSSASILGCDSLLFRPLLAFKILVHFCLLVTIGRTIQTALDSQLQFNAIYSFTLYG
jgi:hypothetical protein